MSSKILVTSHQEFWFRFKLCEFYCHRTGRSAAERGHERSVKALVKLNADMDAQDRDNMCALVIAATRGHVDICRVRRTKEANQMFQSQDWGWHDSIHRR